MDVLTLGGVAFTEYSTPDVMMGGGRQWMQIHKLPGGTRIIDTLGPDDAAIAWRGHFFQNNALGIALQLDGMRRAGQVVELQWAGSSTPVIIDEFIYRARRLPIWVDYTVICTVVSVGAGGGTAPTGSLSGMVSSDLGSAESFTF